MSNPPSAPEQNSKSDEESRIELFQSFSGPLPPPAVLRQYEEICPGCADRLIKAFEAEGSHRREIETRMVDSNIESARSQFREARLGQILAFLISVAFLIAGSYTALSGHPWIGGIFGTMGLSSIAGTFIVGRTRTSQPVPPARHHADKQRKNEN